MTPDACAQLRRQLIRDGYCHVKNVAPLDLIEDIRSLSDALANVLPEEEKQRWRYQGSLINVLDHEPLVPLITLPTALDVLRHLGFPNPRFYAGYIISKPPEVAPPLSWHQDGVLWDEPVSYTDTPHQVFLMYYLVDTNRDNGCLRVIPGSHLKRHRLHDLPHTDEIQDADEHHHPSFAAYPDEVDVPVRAGDLVIGDARLLHAAHPNRSNRRRTVITLWFCPTFDEMPETIQAYYSRQQRQKPPGWSDQSWTLLAPLLTTYTGTVAPSKGTRIPDGRLA